MALFYQWLTAAAETAGAARALVYRDTYLSFHGLRHRVDRRAHELASLGIKAGDWVGLMIGNVPDLVVLILATRKIGAVAVPLDPALSTHEIDMIFAVAPLRALITRPLAETGPPRNPAKGGTRVTPLGLRITDVAHARSPRHQPESKRRLAGTLLTCSVFRREPTLRDEGSHDPAVVHFTSESGGDPKGVLRGDAQFEAIAASLADGLGLTPGQSALLPTPFHCGYGFDLGLVACLAARVTMVLEDELSPGRILPTLRDNQVDLVVGTPALYGALAREVPLRPSSHRRERARFYCLHAPGSERVAAAFQARWQAPLRSLYHLAETGPIARDEHGARPDTGGTLLPGVRLRVSAPDGSPVPDGVRGQIWVHGGGLSRAAVPEPPAVLRVVGPVGVPIGRSDAKGWMRTGDVGMRESSGYVVLRGREDDLVNLDGKRIALGEVEGALESFARVREARARVIYDDVAGPIVVAEVVRSAPCRSEDIIDHCARTLAPYKVPREIRFCNVLD